MARTGGCEFTNGYAARGCAVGVSVTESAMVVVSILESSFPRWSLACGGGEGMAVATMFGVCSFCVLGLLLVVVLLVFGLWEKKV